MVLYSVCLRRVSLGTLLTDGCTLGVLNDNDNFAHIYISALSLSSGFLRMARVSNQLTAAHAAGSSEIRNSRSAPLCLRGQ